MDLLFNSALARASMGAGLSGLSGIRAFLPLALLSLVARLGGFDVVHLQGTSFGILRSWWLIVLLLVLAAVEIALDKMPVLASVQSAAALPLRVLTGALVFGASMSVHGTGAMIAGLVAGAIVAGLAHSAKKSIRPGVTAVSEGEVNPFASLFEDVAVAAGSVVLFVLPLAGILLVLFFIYLVYRIERRRRRKYKGLRILKG